MTTKLLIPSPTQTLPIPIFEQKGLQLLVKREDLIHPHISGNKWRKLKYNLEEARKQGKKHLLTFGGAYSNHLYATAAAGKAFGFATIGLVRGEATEPFNPTLQFAQDCGMQLIFLSRSDYRQKEEMIAQLGFNRADVYPIPEGGTNTLALPGCAEIAEELSDQLPKLPDYICLCCGTGGTAAGLIAGLADQTEVLCFSVLKGNFHQPIIQSLLEDYQKEFPAKLSEVPTRWEVLTQYHCGGYARFHPELLAFINDYKARFQMPLDPIYTGKLFLGIQDLATQDYFKRGSTILALHTGGLQGIAGFNQRVGNLIH